MYIKIIIISVLMIPFFSVSAFAEVIVLKSGKTIQAKIVENNDDYLKIDIAGIPVTYYLDDIESIDGNLLRREDNTIPVSLAAIEGQRIRSLLKDLNYPEHTWPAIESELIIFLTKIDFLRLKQKAAQLKSNPEQLKEFVSEIGALIKREGYLNYQPPHPLAKLLLTGLNGEDPFRLIEASPITPQDKERSMAEITSCSSISQIGSLLLKLLDIDCKTVMAPQHVFNCIPIDNERILFVDLFDQLFEIVDVPRYYRLQGKYYILKEEYRLGIERMIDIKKRWHEERPKLLSEALGYGYFYILITDWYATTVAIFNNLAVIYYESGNFPQAIAKANKAIEIVPNQAESYPILGAAYGKQGNVSREIAELNRAIEINPCSLDAYYNRGFVYQLQNNLSQAFADYSKVIEINPCLAASAYTNRGVIYYMKDDFLKAISDASKAIQIKDGFAAPYNNRGLAYFRLGDFSKAWTDVNKAQSLGYAVDARFLEELRKASGREK